MSELIAMFVIAFAFMVYLYKHCGQTPDNTVTKEASDRYYSGTETFNIGEPDANQDSGRNK